jgi:hypothetical protein
VEGLFADIHSEERCKIPIAGNFQVIRLGDGYIVGDEYHFFMTKTFGRIKGYKSVVYILCSLAGWMRIVLE